MQDKFWNTLQQYKLGNPVSSIDKREFIDECSKLGRLIQQRMYDPSLTGDIFCEYVGSDDGHDDLCDFIIWNGKESVDNFLQDSSSAIPLAERMSQHPGFDNDGIVREFDPRYSSELSRIRELKSLEYYSNKYTYPVYLPKYDPQDECYLTPVLGEVIDV